MQWWSVWCAAALVCARAAAADSLARTDTLTRADSLARSHSPPDDERALPTSDDYVSAATWLDLLGEMDQPRQAKRTDYVLSIDHPMWVLSEKHKQNRELRAHELQAIANRILMDKAGKRGYQAPQSEAGYYY